MFISFIYKLLIEEQVCNTLFSSFLVIRNVMIEWLAILLAVWSSPKFEATPQDWIYVTVKFSSFLSSFLQILGSCSVLREVVIMSFHFSSLSFINHTPMKFYIINAVEKVLLNKFIVSCSTMKLLSTCKCMKDEIKSPFHQ